MKVQGLLLKMKSELKDVVLYDLPVGDEFIHLNNLIGGKIEIKYLNKIHCIRCGRITKTSFAQGYCYPCFISAPETSECVLRPELCRAHEGISRDMAWSKDHCLQGHIVYLALTSGLKAGVTRISQIPTRWIDQGADKAIRLAQTPNRYTAGLIEVALKGFMNDKTNWRNMLTGKVVKDINLLKEKEKVKKKLPSDLRGFISGNDEIVEMHYPLDFYPPEVKSLDLKKTDYFSGTLTGIKGQYIIFEEGTVLNIRNHSGFLVEMNF